MLYDNDNNRVQLPGYRADACTDAAIRYVAEQYKMQQAVNQEAAYLDMHQLLDGASVCAAAAGSGFAAVSSRSRASNSGCA